MNWKRVIEIARWEYLQKVRAKSFIVGLILTPLFISVSMFVPAWLASEEPETTTLIGLIDTSGEHYTRLKAFLDRTERLDNGQPSYLIADYTAGGVSRQSAIQRADSVMLSGSLEGAFVIDDSADGVIASYRSENPGNFRIAETFEKAIEATVRAQRLADAGIDTVLVAEMSPSIDMKTLKVSADGEKGSAGFGETFVTAYLLNFMLLILVVTTGGTLVRSLVEEKSNRIMEILVSSAKPQELMWGKLIGLSGLGLTQMLAWILLGVLGATAFASTGALTGLSSVLALLPLLFVYLLLGYLFYSAIFVGLGSLVTTEQEAQVLTSYLVFVLMTPTILAIGVISNPDAAWLQVLSYIPVFTPALMMLRIVTKMPPAAEIVGTIALMVASTVVLTWACSKIFRTAILLYGKRPSAREVLRWLREA